MLSTTIPMVPELFFVKQSNDSDVNNTILVLLFGFAVSHEIHTLGLRRCTSGFHDEMPPYPGTRKASTCCIDTVPLAAGWYFFIRKDP